MPRAFSVPQFLPKDMLMKIIPRNLLLLAAVASIVVAITAVTESETAPAASIPADAEKAVLARLADIQSAAQALDADKVFSFVMENNAGAIAQNGKLFLTRSDALDSTRQSFESLQAAGARIEYRFDQQHMTFLSPTIALATGEGLTSVTGSDGRIVKTPFAQSVVFVLTNGDWKVFHAHRSFEVPVR
jgi:ketosteroid isomerase-like protein